MKPAGNAVKSKCRAGPRNNDDAGVWPTYSTKDHIHERFIHFNPTPTTTKLRTSYSTNDPKHHQPNTRHKKTAEEESPTKKKEHNHRNIKIDNPYIRNELQTSALFSKTTKARYQSYPKRLRGSLAWLLTIQAETHVQSSLKSSLVAHALGRERTSDDKSEKKEKK